MAAIVSGDIQTRYTVKTGSAGNTTASNGAGSLGTYVSSTSYAGGTLHDLFDAITGAENAASQVDYRAIAVLNTNTANTYQNSVAYISAETAGGASVALAADTTAASALGASTAQLLTAATDTAPGSGVTALTFSSPTTVGAGVALGDIPTNNVKGLWIRRTAANNAALSADGFTLAIAGDTGSA